MFQTLMKLVYKYYKPFELCFNSMIGSIIGRHSVSKFVDLGENQHPNAHNFPLLCALFGANFPLSTQLQVVTSSSYC